MAIIETLLTNAQVFTLYLPFLFVFAIFYALLVKTKVFGQGGQANKLNAIVALIAAAYVALFSPLAGSISMFFASMFALGSVGLVTLLIFIMVVGLLMGPFVTTQEGWEKLGKKFIPLIVIVAFLFALGLFFSSASMADWFGGTVAPSFGIDISGEDIALIVLIVITIIILYWLTGGEEGIKSVKLFGET
jgi:Mn2+/Fe2+ NRAMP family transporter